MDSIFKDGWWILLSIVVLVVLFFYMKLKERKIDSQTDYSKENLGGRFQEVENGNTWLTYPYQSTQPNKKKYILDHVKQFMEISDEHGSIFVVSNLVADEYYNMVPDGQGGFTKTGNPYVVFNVIPKTKTSDSRTIIESNNAPVQVVFEGATATQIIENSSFSNKIEKFRDLMIDRGIPEEDINVVINFKNNENVKQSFLSKYGLELAKITVEISGVVMNLLDFFTN